MLVPLDTCTTHTVKEPSITRPVPSKTVDMCIISSTSKVWQFALTPRSHDYMGESAQSTEWFLQLLGIVPTDACILKRMGEMCDAEGDKSQAFQYHYDVSSSSCFGEILSSNFLGQQKSRTLQSGALKKWTMDNRMGHSRHVPWGCALFRVSFLRRTHGSELECAVVFVCSRIAMIRPISL